MLSKKRAFLVIVIFYNNVRTPDLIAMTLGR